MQCGIRRAIDQQLIAISDAQMQGRYRYARKQHTMSTMSLALPAPRRLALQASRVLERWAMQPHRDEQQQREQLAYEAALEAREQRNLDALARQMLA